jgi:hypothetical protein
LIALSSGSLGPWTTQIVVVAAAELAGELPIQEKGHVGLNSPRAYGIIGNQPSYSGLDEGRRAARSQNDSVMDNHPGDGRVATCIADRPA